MLKIRKQRKKLEAKIKKYEDKLKKLQEECSHVGGHYIAYSNTGNWDPNDDSWSVSIKCKYCGYRDMFDSEKDSKAYRYITGMQYQKSPAWKRVDSFKK